MSKITQSARGQACQVRLIGVCNGNRETVVLAHYRRLAGVAGMGIKPPDFLGAYACSACHDVIDGRVSVDMDETEIALAHADGVMRTMVLLEKQGLLGVD